MLLHLFLFRKTHISSLLLMRSHGRPKMESFGVMKSYMANGSRQEKMSWLPWVKMEWPGGKDYIRIRTVLKKKKVTEKLPRVFSCWAPCLDMASNHRHYRVMLIGSLPPEITG